MTAKELALLTAMADTTNQTAAIVDNIDEDLVDKADDVDPETSNRKSKRSRSDTRKSHRSKSSSSRKSKSSHRGVDTRNRKESRDARERKASPEICTTPIRIKEEETSDQKLSDDQNSEVSESRPVLLTRSRIRRIERRKAYSSHSSVVESDKGRTKSEPIIITLDSDSEEDNLSMISNRPNRTARIRGELIRKLSRTASAKINSYKSHDSSSSSECESAKRKKKSKAKSVKSSSSQASKRKKYLVVNRLPCHSRLKIRKHKKPHISHVYRPLKKKKDFSKIRKHLEQQKKAKLMNKSSSVKKSSHQSPVLTERRMLRSTSTDTNADNVTKQQSSDIEPKSQQISRPKSQQEAPKPSVENKKLSDTSPSKKHAKKDTNLADVKEDVAACASEEPAYDSKIESAPEPEEKMDPLQEETMEENLEPECIGNQESECDQNLQEAGDNDIQTTSADLALQDSAIEDQPSENDTPEGKSDQRVLLKSEFQQKIKKIKKKMKPTDKILRKRGRPRLSDVKPVKDIPILDNVIQLPFLQNTFCFNIAPKLPKCRECRIAVNRCNRNMLHAYCRFMEYRKLCYSRTGIVLNAGFSEPSEATPEHLNQWLPQLDDPPKDLNCGTSKALLEHIGDQFCDLVEQEKEALSLHIGRDSIITWKRIVQGVREMCDVCYTTLFNYHWVCPVCGLAVCIDCYKGRKQGITVEYEDGQPKNRDQYNWLLCSLKQPHDPVKLILAQIIPGNALWTMRDLLHKARTQWDIPSYCRCNPQAITSSDKYISTGICKQLMCFVTKSFSSERSNLYFNNDTNVQNGESNYDDLDFEVSGSALKWLEGSMIGSSDDMKSSDDFCNSYEDFASLRGNLLNGMNDDDISSEPDREVSSFSLDDIIACVTKSQNADSKETSGKSVIKHFSNRYPQPISGRDPLPIRIYTKLESNLAFVNVPHSWFCNGRLLFLLQSDHPENLALFQEQWKRGQPILVKGVDESLSKELWHPEAFSRDFGDVRNDLVDCRTGAIIKNLPMRRFWEGFESFAKRLKDDDGQYMLLKLKDWPPGEDFSEMLPRRFDDLMKGLPLPEYTHRDGILNLAGRLPSWFVRPDLGPKMYNAYGSALYPTKGTTNLHLDISDAVNVMVYVGIPQDGNAQLHIEEALKAIDEGGCDSLMRARVRARGAKPGALWHIYNARDADKIRELLTKVAIERGEKLEAHHDPIHDQSWYLDAELRKRLYRDYGVEGYAIAQCLGDAVFIPAGAPHQVRNLHSCVKVAEDFVSPENIAHCFKLTQEFRHLSDTHTNHEDKLQIKNIIYHVVRDALAHLLADGDSFES